jgi:hypothetical protein
MYQARGACLSPYKELHKRQTRLGRARSAEPVGWQQKTALESDVEEGILYIELLNGPVTEDSSGEHRANGGRFHNRVESLIVVDSRALSKTPKDPVSLVAIKGPVSAELVRENLLAGDNVGALRPGNRLSSPIAHQGLVLILHSRMPIGIGERSTRKGRDRGRCR